MMANGRAPSTAVEVKGVALRGVLKDAKEHGGVARLMDAIPAEARRRYFGETILHSVWYPYAAFASVLEAYDATSGRGSVSALRELGARTAARDQSSLLRVFALFTTPQRVADAGCTVWEQRFRGTGKMTVSDRIDRGWRLNIAFTGIHPLHCEFLTGYGLASGKRWVESFSVQHDRCVHRGAADCSFHAHW